MENYKMKKSQQIIVGILFGVFIVWVFSLFISDNEPKEDFWNKFDPIVKERINNHIQNGNCTELQKEFDTTESNSQRNRKSGRSSRHFVDLMRYIDENMKEIGCY